MLTNDSYMEMFHYWVFKKYSQLLIITGYDKISILRSEVYTFISFPSKNLKHLCISQAADTKIVDQHRLRCLLSGQTTSASQNGAVCSSLPHGGAGDYDQKINQIAMGVSV